MGTKCGVDSAKASFSEIVACKDNTDPQSSVVSTATNPLNEVEVFRRRSCSDGVIDRRRGVADASTESSEGTSAMHSSSRKVVSLEHSLSLWNHSKNRSSWRENQMDDIDCNFKLTPKVLKHLMAESSCSNSSNASVFYRSEKKSPKEISVDAEPSSSVEEKDNRAFRLNLVDSVPLNRGKGSNEAVNQKKSFNGYDSQDEWSNMTTKQPGTEKAKERSQESCLRQVHGPKDAMTLSKSIASTEPSRTIFGFDLNVDLGVHEVEIPCLPHPNNLSIAAHHAVNGSRAIAVMSKIGVPNGLPSAPLQFDGQLGWRRSSSTSAFRRVLRHNYSDRTQKISNNNNTDSERGGFDLNIALSMDSSPIEFDSSALTTDFCSTKSSVDASLRKSQGLSLNFNCGDEGGNDNHLKLQTRAFDLNEKISSQETCNAIYQPGQSGQPVRQSVSANSTMASSREGPEPFNQGLARPAYWVGFGSIPGVAHIQGQPFLVASGPNFLPSLDSQPRQEVVPLQSKRAFAPGLHAGFCIQAPNTLSYSSQCSPSIFPSLIDQSGSTTFIPQLPSRPMLATYQAGPSIHLLDSSNSQELYSNIGGYMNMTGPSYSLNNGVGMASSEKGNGGGNANESSFEGSRNQSYIGERTKLPPLIVSSSPVSVKRREPGGGWDSFQQLACRRMTTWKWTHV